MSWLGEYERNTWWAIREKNVKLKLEKKIKEIGEEVCPKRKLKVEDIMKRK